MALGFTTYSEAAYAQSSVITDVEQGLTGVQATGAIGNVGVTSPELVIPTGVEATGAIGQALGRAGFVFAKPRGNETFTITVQSTDSGNKYYVNDFRQLMPTALHKGFTYIFDQSDSSNNNHPLRFSTTPNGSHAGGSEYTDGVTVVGTPGQAGAYTQIVVADNAPSQLYTYCINHSGMGFSVSVEANVEIKSTSVVGNATAIPQMIVVPTGVQATGAIGNVSIKLSAIASVTGVSASVSTSNVLVWSEIDTVQDPNWVEIAA
ncbi:MAG: hypothetical protein GOVbin2604_40 [Gammaproteobacteria virus GOV_bin_2604]|nr:MAG: hypothetical protein GOVbin2604_40 [Gammaproteobacteria virus GOV_bin_2604]|tara:strand:- start:1645 stop:2433 length:789 start_codon:yes stop_codon:yes gene_type:complete